MPADQPRRRRVATALGATVVAGSGAVVVLCAVTGLTWSEAYDAFVVTNTLMGLTFGTCGALVARHRPTHPLGWLLLLDGLGHLVSALTVPAAVAVDEAGGPQPVVRLLVTLCLYAWPVSIGALLPLALLLFPTGRPPSRRWRPVLVAVVVTAPLFVVEMGTDPAPPLDGLPTGYLTLASHDDLSGLWLVAELRTTAALALGLIALVVRYRRADERGRRQLLWLLLAALGVVTIVVPWAFLAGTPIGVLLAIPLVPVAVAIAIVRDQLLDIRLVVSRAVAWLCLSLLALGVYAVVTGVLADLAIAATGRASVAAVVVALVLAPVLPRLQREVERLFYGLRREPARLVSSVGAGLAGGDGELGAVVERLRGSLRLPYLAVSAGEAGSVAAGIPPHDAGQVVRVPLTYGGEAVGTLDVGLRPGERELAPPDRHALDLVAVILAVAVRAVELTAGVQRSREQIVLAREEERRRLRRDLHDGLGPALTGMALAADAVHNLLGDGHDEARSLLGTLRRDTRATLAEVRRVIDELRPPALDELGLAEALRQHAAGLTRSVDGAPLRVRVQAPAVLPELPAAVEVAAYRIATEALTNVVRHAGAGTACLTIRCADQLEVELLDDGSAAGTWTPGVGLQSMWERAAELGGRLEAGASTDGGRVFVSLPVAAP